MDANGNISGPSNGPTIVIPGIVFFVVVPMVVAIRFWSRLRLNAALGSDDWSILASMILSLTDSAVLIASCSFGFGKHVVTLTPENKASALQLFYLSQIFYKISINLTKASIILFYLRLFPQNLFHKICHGIMVVVVLYGIATTFATTFQCTPVSRAWDKTIPGTCINITAFWYANAGYSISTDVMILVLPMPVIWGLRLRKAQKIGLMGVFALGIFVISTSVLRMTTLNLSSTSPDQTFDIASTSWTIIECNIAIICACLPMFRLPLHILCPTLFGSMKNSTPSPYPYVPSPYSSHPYSNGLPSKYLTSKSEEGWVGIGRTPGRGGKPAGDIKMSSLVTASKRGPEDSDEFILQGHGQEGELSGAMTPGGGIRKEVGYSVKYDDESMMGSRSMEKGRMRERLAI